MKSMRRLPRPPPCPREGLLVTAELVIVCSPVRGADRHWRTVRLPLTPGVPLAHVLPPDIPAAQVSISGKVIAPEAYMTTLVQDQDEVWLIPRWGIESSVLIPLLIYAAVGIAVGIATTALTYLLFPPAKPHIQQAVDEPTFSFEGIRTTIGPGNVVPVHYGRVRVAGQLLSAAVEQAMTVIDVDPSGATAGVPHAIDNVYGGDLSLDGTVGNPIVVVANTHGASTGSHVDIGGVTGKTAANGGWYVTYIDDNTLSLQSSAGIDQRAYTGGGILVVLDTPATAPTRRVDAIAAAPTLNLLLGFGEGPIGGFLTETMELNGQPLGNFPQVLVYVRNGYSDQTAIPEFGETANTFADGRVIAADPGIVYTTTQAVQAFALNIVFQEGLFFLTKTGEKEENVTTLGYRYRVHPAGTWTNFSFFDVAAARTSPVRFGIRREGLPLAIYDVHVEFSHARQVNDVQAKWMPTLESVTEIQHNTNAYPNTPLLGLRAVATDALQGALPNVTIEILGRIIRVNEFTQNWNYSQDPAWCTMDMMTHPRYGLGIPDAEIDLGSFSAWWAYNTQTVNGKPRHTFNYSLDRELRAQPALLEMAGNARTLLLKDEGIWTARPTRDETPVQLFNWANCTNVKLRYTRDPDRINVMEGRFNNAENGYLQDVITWPAVDDWPAEVRKASLDLRGITVPSEVMQALQFELNRRRFETLIIEMDVALDAARVQRHDLFRFAHPLPGWGTGGRLLATSTTTTLFLDLPVTFVAGKTYHIYIRHTDLTTEVRTVNHPGASTVSAITLAAALSQTPDQARGTLWAFGELTPVDTAVKVFRVTALQRKSDTTVHIQGIIHNPSIYDEATATSLPVISNLFNPAGPAPPITSLILTEVTRIQASGASLRVVNLSWDVAALSAGFGPYGGALILRRAVLESSGAGVAQAGIINFGAIQDPSDANVNFIPLIQLRGHVLDYDDYTVLTGTTYVYRVVPISQGGTPNNTGAREAMIHVAGPTTPDFFPGTVQQLRLKGQAVGVTDFEGRDVHIEWLPVADSPLFTQTYFVQDYIVEVWAPGQQYLMRRTTVLAGSPGVAIQWTYTLEQNAEDQARAGMGGARRDMWFFVWARTNTNRISLDPAILKANNPPPDMGDMIPEIVPFLFVIIDFSQFVQPRDFDHYEIHLDLMDPPIAIYDNLSAFSVAEAKAFSKIFVSGLQVGATYYTYILPYDSFGPGIPTHTASFVPAGITADSFDSTPPADPTGLALTTGVDLSSDGTTMSWVEASWDLAMESDVAGYEVHVYLNTSTSPTVYNPERRQHLIHIPVPGNTPVMVRLLTFDKFHNVSGYSADVSIISAKDTTPPAAPTNLLAVGSIRSIALLWTPPPDGDYAYSEIWSAPVNNRASATRIGTGESNFIHDGLGPNDTRYYWLRAVDTSGNGSAAFQPASAIAGVAGTAGQLDSTFISSLIATKITAGTIQALVRLGVNNIVLDGVNNLITIFDSQNVPVPRVYLGKLGTLNTAYGMQIFDANGVLMWNFTDGAQTAGISDAAVVARHIRAGSIEAAHLQTEFAVITVGAQIANALIEDAKILTLSAPKITAGALQAVYSIGVGGDAITLDGPNHLITIFDNQNTPAARVYLGKIGATNIDYGMQIWSWDGQLMWDFNSGATSHGIGTLAVTTPKVDEYAITTPKIGLAAVSESLLYSSASIISSSGTETVVASLTFTLLNPGDVVLFLAQGIGSSGVGQTMTVRIRENNLSGNILNSTAQSDAGTATSIALNAFYQVPSALSGKSFYLTLNQTLGSGGLSVSDVSFIALRLQR